MQKYQTPCISTKLNIYKAFDCGSSSLYESTAVEKESKESLKRSLATDMRSDMGNLAKQIILRIGKMALFL